MIEYELGDVIAERKLDLICADGSIVPCGVLVGKPVQIDDDTWVCPYRIEAGEQSSMMGMHGIDSMQAMILTTKTLDVEIAHIAKKFGAEVGYLDGSHESVFNP